MVSKINPSGSELVKTLVGKKHLAKRFKLTGTPPWLLHSLDMLRFRDGGTKTVWIPKSTNEFPIVNKRVLPWKIEAISANTTCTKNFPMAVKLLKHVV